MNNTTSGYVSFHSASSMRQDGGENSKPIIIKCYKCGKVIGIMENNYYLEYDRIIEILCPSCYKIKKLIK